MTLDKQFLDAIHYVGYLKGRIADLNDEDRNAAFQILVVLYRILDCSAEDKGVEK
jgi:hypothetical protein